MTSALDETERDGRLIGPGRRPPRTTAVRALPDARLAVTFETGERREVALGPWLDCGVFRALRDPPALAAVEVVNHGGGVGWPSGADLRTDSLSTGALPPPPAA